VLGAAHALAQIGTPAAQTALLEAAATGSGAAQAAAIDALSELPVSPELVTALLGTLASRSAAVRQGAAEAVARLAAQPAAEGAPALGAETLAALLALLQSDDAPLVRRAAALALGRIGDPSARDALEASQADAREDPLVRQAAGEALARLRQPKAASEEPVSDSAIETPAEQPESV
jgi:HEAT repeat protein